ncbi:origin recognition complex subunit 4 [Harmonia axyridis]|uniref:origin recognition complex subunit 4 n=1 Tax=Harmonia axyridis TaxID=115357 RepID=UPI001E275163|nr:origin recognition complex subunit 4 [Harmonia axyridis]XP_045473400.1 origin recognition complex subunit 4 [Harmonia axyridis]
MKENTPIYQIRKCLFEKLQNISYFKGQLQEREKILKLIQSTVEYGESNSALIIGSRASGKTTLVNDIIREVTLLKTFEDNALLVRLHGFVHTNDNLALKAITRQMNLLNVVEGKVFGSFAENLAFLLDSLKSGNKETSKSIIFILEEFDSFCKHHNQTLLYNLFDISQSAQTAICVLGLTCRLDVVELLEKRVKSRFSHRQLFLFSDTYADEKGMFIVMMDNIKSLLILKRSDSDAIDNIPASYISKWNKQVQHLLENKSFKSILQRFMDIDISKNRLKIILIPIISSLRDDNDTITVESFQEQLNKFEQDGTIQAIHDLSVLELCLIIAMKHHTDIFNKQPMNFEMVLTRYTKFANANSSVQSVQRPVVMKAFEHLQNLELISFVSGGGSRIQKEYQLFKLEATSQQIAEAVKSCPGLPTEVVQWAKSSLI